MTSGGETRGPRRWLVTGASGQLARSFAALAAPLSVVEDQLGRPTWSGALATAILAGVRAGARGTLHLPCEWRAGSASHGQ